MPIEWLEQLPCRVSPPLSILLWPDELSILQTRYAPSPPHAFAMNEFSPVIPLPSSYPFHPKDPAQMSPLLWSIPQGQDDALFSSMSPVPGTESKLMKCVLNEPVNETEEQSQYPMTDKNLGFVIWQTWIFMDLFLDLQRCDLGQITASFGEVTSLAVQ